MNDDIIYELATKYLLRCFPIKKLREKNIFKSGVILLSTSTGYNYDLRILLNSSTNKEEVVKHLTKLVSEIFTISSTKANIIVKKYFNL